MCLAYCRSPAGFILSEWRDGMLRGAVMMGMRHRAVLYGLLRSSNAAPFRGCRDGFALGRRVDDLVTSEKLLPGAKIWRLTIAVGLIAIAVGFALAGWKFA